jgi:integrase
MSAIFNHAMRYEWVEKNPIKLVRQSAKRERIPDVLELEELQLLLSKLGPRERTLVLLDAATGLRVSELLSLKWEDIDFENLGVRVIRSIWHQVVGDCKTETSARPVPLDSYMAEALPLAARQSIRHANRLGFCQSDHEGEAALLAGQLDEAVHPACRKSGRHSQTNRLAHLPPYLRHSAQGERGRCEDRPGALTAREQPHHAGGLHASRDFEQARRTEQGCEDDGSKRGHNGDWRTCKISMIPGLLCPYRAQILLSL